MPATVNRRADCHPDRPYWARGLCGTCYLKAWKKRHPARQTELQRRWTLKKQYNMTVADHRAMWDRQHGSCAVCNRLMVWPGNIDHNHHTKKVRGLLCHHCNILAQEPEHLRAVLRYMRLA